PISGMLSQDVHLVEGRDADSGDVRCAGAPSVPALQFARDCLSREDGTFFQEVLAPHPEIAARISDRLCTIRLIGLLEAHGVRLFRPLWKIGAGGNIADNYWHPGNLLARLDLETGRIDRCVTGLGHDFRVVERHPVTGEELKGFPVPFYREAVDLVRRIAPA